MVYGTITPPGTTPLTIEVNGVVAVKLDNLAKERGQTRTRFITDLFLAAYSARIKPTGDAALDAAVRDLDAPCRSSTKLQELQEQHKTAGEAEDGRAALQAMLKTLQQNYAAKEQELRAVRAELAGAKKSSGPDQSGNVLELRRKAIEADAVIARVKREAAAEVAAMRKELEAAAKATRDAGNKIGGLTAENMRLKKANEAAAADTRVVDELRRQIAELTKERDKAADALVAAGQEIERCGDAERAAADECESLREQLRREAAAAAKEIAALKRQICEHQEARLALARKISEQDAAILSLRDQNAALQKQQPVESLPPMLHGAAGEIAKIWSAINELRAKILGPAPAPEPARLSPQEEADLLSAAVVKSIRGFRAAGNDMAAISRFTGASVEAVKIICGLAPTKTQQDLAAAKAKVGAR